MKAQQTETLAESSPRASLYPIRAVSRLTGLTAAKLRAWENRYRAINPSRAGRGRLYSQADVDRLILLRNATEQGHDISQIAALSDESLRQLTTPTITIIERRPESLPQPTNKTEIDLSPVLRAFRQFETVEADRELSRLVALLGPHETVFQVIQPLIKQIDDLSESGALTIAHGHMAAVTLRNLLGTMVRNVARANSPKKVLFATLSGHRYEFGLLCGAILASGRGLKAIYLGVDLPAKEIVGAAWATGVSAVVLGLNWNDSVEPIKEDFQSVISGLSDGVELWVGGYKIEHMPDQLKKRSIKYLTDLNDLDQNLSILAEHF